MADLILQGLTEGKVIFLVKHCYCEVELMISELVTLNDLLRSSKDEQIRPPNQIELWRKPRHTFSLLRKNCKYKNKEMIEVIVTEHSSNTDASLALPIVVDVMDARIPIIQEKGREMAIAPDPSFPTCPYEKLGTMICKKSRVYKLLYLPKAAQENKSKQAC